MGPQTFARNLYIYINGNCGKLDDTFALATSLPKFAGYVGLSDPTCETAQGDTNEFARQGGQLGDLHPFLCHWKNGFITGAFASDGLRNYTPEI